MRIERRQDERVALRAAHRPDEPERHVCVELGAAPIVVGDDQALERLGCLAFEVEREERRRADVAAVVPHVRGTISRLLWGSSKLTAPDRCGACGCCARVRGIAGLRPRLAARCSVPQPAAQRFRSALRASPGSLPRPRSPHRRRALPSGWCAAPGGVRCARGLAHARLASESDNRQPRPIARHLTEHFTAGALQPHRGKRNKRRATKPLALAQGCPAMGPRFRPGPQVQAPRASPW